MSTTTTTTTTTTFKDLKTINALAIPTGSRVCRIIKKKGQTSLAAFLPTFSTAEIADFIAKPDVADWIRGKLEEVQDDLFRPLATSEEISVPLTAGSWDAMLLAIVAEKETGRLSKAAIEQWFKNDMQPRLVATLVKKGLGEVAITGAVKMFSEGFVILAGKEPHMKDALKQQLLKALALFEDEYSSRVAELIAEKLVTVTEAAPQADVL